MTSTEKVDMAANQGVDVTNVENGKVESELGAAVPNFSEEERAIEKR